MAAPSSFENQLSIDDVIFHIREELLSNPVLTDVHLRDENGDVVKVVRVSAPVGPRTRSFSRKDTQLLQKSTRALTRLSQFYSRYLPRDSVAASQGPSVVVNDAAHAQHAAPHQPYRELKEEVKEDGPRYPKRDRRSTQVHRTTSASVTITSSRKRKKRRTPAAVHESARQEVKRYFRLLQDVYMREVSDNVAWSDLVGQVDATTRDTDDATFMDIAEKLTGQQQYHHTFKMITYYLRAVLAIKLQQRYQGKSYQEKAKELLDIQSQQDVAAYPQFGVLIQTYYEQELEDAHGLAFITVLKADIPWREWREKSNRRLIEIALRRFYQNHGNRREDDRYDYSDTDFPPETTDNKDIYDDDDEDVKSYRGFHDDNGDEAEIGSDSQERSDEESSHHGDECN